TRSDTEVLLRAWEAWGEACVDRLRGMFALAIWDAPRRRLTLARDRLGKKPLYYWHRDGVFVFASEPKALLRHPAVGRDLAPVALEHSAAFGYTPAARSIFDGIAKLPPGHIATLADGALTLRRYWTLPDGAAASVAAMPLDDLRARVRAEVRDAVRARLEADVPLGVFLSGGVDSSAIVACMRDLNVARLATLSGGLGWGSAPTPRTTSCPMRAWPRDASRPSITRTSSSRRPRTLPPPSSARSTSRLPIPRRSRRSPSPRALHAASRWRCQGSAAT